MIKRKNILKIAIDSPAAAGAGTLAKAISKHYNLFWFSHLVSINLKFILNY
jgi:cytidylate kinase